VLYPWDKKHKIKVENDLPTLSFDIKAVFKQMNQPTTTLQVTQDTPVQPQPMPAVIEPVEAQLPVVKWSLNGRRTGRDPTTNIVMQDCLIK
jgi:hypothetical protein